MENPFKKPDSIFKTSPQLKEESDNDKIIRVTVPKLEPIEVEKDDNSNNVLDKIKESLAKPLVKEEVKDNKVILQEGYVKKTRRQQILEQYGGLESNIPVNSSYWNTKG